MTRPGNVLPIRLERHRNEPTCASCHATLDPYPAFPKTKLNLLLGFVFAFCTSCGLAFLSDSYDRWRHSGRGIPADRTRGAVPENHDAHGVVTDESDALEDAPEVKDESVEVTSRQEAEALAGVAARPR